MHSRETRVILVCITLAAALFVLFQDPSVDPTDRQILAVLVGVGIILPTVMNNYLDSHGES